MEAGIIEYLVANTEVIGVSTTVAVTSVTNVTAGAVESGPGTGTGTQTGTGGIQ